MRYRLPDGERDATSSPRTRATSTTRGRCTRRCRAGAEPLDAVDSVEALPDAARDYVEFVERELDVEVWLVGTGAEPRARARRGGVEALAGR